MYFQGLLRLHQLMTTMTTYCYIAYVFSGAVKITPAHDHNDYEVGKRHNLQFLTLIDNNGNMCDICGQFSVSFEFLKMFLIIYG